MQYDRSSARGYEFVIPIMQSRIKQGVAAYLRLKKPHDEAAIYGFNVDNYAKNMVFIAV